MKDFLLDLVASLLVSCLPSNVRTVARPLFKKGLVWVVEGVVIWARAVRRDFED